MPCGSADESVPRGLTACDDVLEHVLLVELGTDATVVASALVVDDDVDTVFFVVPDGADAVGVRDELLVAGVLTGLDDDRRRLELVRVTLLNGSLLRLGRKNTYFSYTW